METWKWWFPREIYSRVPFSGSMLNFGRAKINRWVEGVQIAEDIGFLLKVWGLRTSLQVIIVVGRGTCSRFLKYVWYLLLRRNASREYQKKKYHHIIVVSIYSRLLTNFDSLLLLPELASCCPSKNQAKRNKTTLQDQSRTHLVGGWTNPSEKYVQVKLDHFPICRGDFFLLMETTTESYFGVVPLPSKSVRDPRA